MKWVLLELGSWTESFDFRNFIIEEDYDSYPVYVIFNFEDNFIKITSSDFDFKNGGYQKVEYEISKELAL